MIVSFYNNKFEGLANNASLSVDNKSYSLILRGIDLDDLSCKCESFTEDIQPTFLVIKNDRGNYIYGCLAGIPERTSDNQTKITGTDLKTMLKSDVVLDLTTNKWSSVNEFIQFVFDEWRKQVNQDSFNCILQFNTNVGEILFDNLEPSSEKISVYDAWEDIFTTYLKYYGLFMQSKIDLINKRIIFTIGKSMNNPLNIKLWEYGIYNYGKWVADTNEAQGAVLNTATGEVTYGYKWILTSQNAITKDEEFRDIYPIKRVVTLKETENSEEISSLLSEANQEALENLTDSMFNEDLTIENLKADFESACNIYPTRGEGLYKTLPVGELKYDSSGLISVQIGYRFTGIQFLLR